MKIKSEKPPSYRAPSTSDDTVIQAALRIIEDRFQRGAQMTAPSATRQYLKIKLSLLEVEQFHALWLDTQHRLIVDEILASGTIDGAAVYPREVLKGALAHNAAAVIFAHNHPSGSSEPSAADRSLTDRLKAALALVDVRVLDHFVVGAGEPVSFAERGWI